MKESVRHLDAFEYFFSLGDKRSLQSVSRKFAVSRVSVGKWCKLFNWHERVDQRNQDIAKKLAKKTDSSIIKDKENYANFSKALVADAVKQFKGEPTVFECEKCGHQNSLNQPRLRCHSIFDVERAVKLHLFLVGEPTEHIKVTEEKITTFVNHVVLTMSEFIEGDDLLKFEEKLRAIPENGQ